jgi:peptide/nickel transport system permease protein
MFQLSLRTQGFVGCVIVGMMVLIVLLAPVIAPYDPNQSGIVFLGPPSAENWLGTDDLGRDTLSRLLYGGRSSLMVGIGAALISLLIGMPIGLAAGYAGGKTDLVVRQFIDLFIALPGLVLALIITAVTGPTLINLMLVLGFVNWPRVARLARGQTLAIRETVFVEAARAAGAGPAWIMWIHVWPNIARIIAAQFALTVSYSVFTSASLSFLGLGVPPPTPDWGSMVRIGFDYLAISPAMSLAPSAAVALMVFGFYLIGTGIE